MSFQIPWELVGGLSTMSEAFERVGGSLGDDETCVGNLFSLLPPALKQAVVWLDKLTNLWRYVYGFPLDRLSGDTHIIGTHMFPPVAELYSALRIANRRLTPIQLNVFLKRLSDAKRHADVLFEMRPVRDLNAAMRTNYEVVGLGVGNTTIDWEVKTALVRVLFEVKNRSVSLIDHFQQIIPEMNRGSDNVIPRAPDPADLFRSVEKKFSSRCYLAQLQGVWLHSDIKEDERQLTQYFETVLNPKKVHFTVISDWQPDAFILARNCLIKRFLRRLFHLTESKRFVTDKYSQSGKT